MNDDPLDEGAGLREELVAYLDGELDTEQSRRIEQRAASEPETRRMLEEFDRTWHVLDELDAPPVNDDFARTTLEMAAVAAAEEARKIQVEAPRRRLRTWLLAVGGLAAAAAAGFLVVAGLVSNFAPPSQDAGSADPSGQDWVAASCESLLKDLPILENLDRYRKVHGIEVLREMNKQKLFSEDAGHGR